MLARAERRPAPPPPGTTWRVAVGARVIPGRGLGSRVRALSPSVLAAAECRVAAFSLLRGVSEMSQGGLPSMFEASGGLRGLLGRRGTRPQRAKMRRRAGCPPRGCSRMRPGLPKRGDSEWVTSPVQGWRAQGGSEQWVNRRGGQN